MDGGVESKFGEQIVRLQLTRLSKYITNKSFSGYQPKGILRYLIAALNLIFKKFLLFPDEWITEQEKIKQALKIIEPDIIIASMHPFSMGQIALKYKEQASETPKIVFDIGDPFAHNAVGQNTSVKSIDFEKMMLHKADHVIVTNDSTKAHYINMFNVKEEDISIITQGIDLETFPSSPRSNKTAKRQLIYAGAFYPKLRDPSLFLKAMEDHSKEFDILIFGNHLPMFRESASESKFLGRVDQKELAKYYHEADGLLFFDNKEGMQTSGKIYELLALKKPIIFIYENDESPVLDLCKDYNHIMYIKNNMESIREKTNEIDGFLNSDFDFDYDITRFSWKEKARQFDKILKMINA
jgi:glycosyltransferase involved in cell wall biosynthesis